MTTVLAAAPKAPDIDWAAFSPLLALLGGACIVLLAGLFRARGMREQVVPLLTVASFGATIGLAVWRWDDQVDLISGALSIDRLTLLVTLLISAAGILATLLAWRGSAAS